MELDRRMLPETVFPPVRATSNFYYLFSVRALSRVRTGLVLMLLCNLGLRSTLKPQCGKVCFIVKSGIGLGDLRLCLL